MRAKKCRKCGKPILDESYLGSLCPRCEADLRRSSYASPATTYHVSSRMYGFGKSVAGIILGAIGLLFSGFTLITVITTFFSSVFTNQSLMTAMIIDAIIGVFLVLPSSVLAGLSLQYGSQSIKAFRYKYAPRPIATLVLGIHSLVFSIISLIIILICFIFLALILV